MGAGHSDPLDVFTRVEFVIHLGLEVGRDGDGSQHGLWAVVRLSGLTGSGRVVRSCSPADQGLDFGEETVGVGGDVGDGAALGQAGSEVANRTEPGIAQEGVSLDHHCMDLTSARMAGQDVVRGREVDHGCGESPVSQQFPRDQPVTDRIGMHSVPGQGEVGGGLTSVGDEPGHRSVDIDDFPSIASSGNQPFGVAMEDVVVSDVGGWIGVETGGQGTALEGKGIEDGRGEMNDARTGGEGGVTKATETVVMAGGAIVGIGEIDAVVHAITGDDEIWLDLVQGTFEAFVEVGPWEGAAGMTSLGQTGDGFRWEPKIDVVGGSSGMTQAAGGLDPLHPGAGVRDAVAEEEDASGGGGIGRGGDPGGGTAGGGADGSDAKGEEGGASGDGSHDGERVTGVMGLSEPGTGGCRHGFPME